MRAAISLPSFVVLAGFVAMSCRPSSRTVPGAGLKTDKVEASIYDYTGGDLGSGSHASVSLTGVGPYGHFRVQLNDGKIGAAARSPGELVASPGGERLAYTPSTSRSSPWFVFYLTPHRQRVNGGFEFAPGALASSSRTQPAGPVDWDKVPALGVVAVDIAREEATSSADYLTDPYGEIARRGGEPALVELLKATADIPVRRVHDDLCDGVLSSWLLAYHSLATAAAADVAKALIASLHAGHLTAHQLFRIAVAAPLDTPELAPAIADRVREITGATEVDDAARAVLLRRVTALDPPRAADVACAYLTAPSRAKNTFGASENAAFLAIAHARRACPAVVALVPDAPSPSEVAAFAPFADEAREPQLAALRRVGGCAGETRYDYAQLARSVQSAEPRGER